MDRRTEERIDRFWPLARMLMLTPWLTVAVLAIGVLVLAGDPGRPEPPAGLLAWLTAASVLSGAVAALARSRAPFRWAAAGASDPVPATLLVSSLVVLAPVEFPAVFGFVAAVMSGRPLTYFYFAAFTVLLWAAVVPKRSTWSEWAERLESVSPLVPPPRDLPGA